MWGGLVTLVVLTPIGLLAPGTAWGEWSREQLQQLGLGYIPAGFDQWSGLWRAPLSGYNLGALNNSTAGYLLSAVLGVALVLLIIFALAWLGQRLINRKTVAAEK